jgi:transposase-like protein
MPHRYPEEVRHQVIELARSGTKVAQLAETFGMSDATIYNWLKQERIDRGEVEGLSTDQALVRSTTQCRTGGPPSQVLRAMDNLPKFALGLFGEPQGCGRSGR